MLILKDFEVVNALEGCNSCYFNKKDMECPTIDYKPLCDSGENHVIFYKKENKTND